jgi:DHA1 family tetracycline resistance protein-like MFS transporter
MTKPMNTKMAVTFVLLTVVIDAMGIGLIMPVTPDLIRELLGKGLAEAALWGGLLSASFAVMQFLCGPAIGSLSDRYGRKPVLLASLFVVAVDYVIMGFTGSIWVLLIGRTIAGIASATHSTATAFVADISKPSEKAQNFGMIGAAFGIGFILGPMLGGLLSEFGSRAPFFGAAILAFGNLVFGAIVLSETVTDKIRRALAWKRINPFGALAQVGSLPRGRVLLLIFFIHQIAFFSYPSVWAFYMIEKFDWTPVEVGFSLAMFGITLAFAQGFLIRIIVPRIGEWNSLGLGLVVAIIAHFAFAFAWTGWMIYVLIFAMALSFLTTPSLQGIASRAASDDAQGELQGVFTSVGAVATIIGPLVMTGIFGYFASKTGPTYFPGAPYLFAGFLDLIALLILLCIWRQDRKVST